MTRPTTMTKPVKMFLSTLVSVLAAVFCSVAVHSAGLLIPVFLVVFLLTSFAPVRRVVSVVFRTMWAIMLAIIFMPSRS